MSDQEFEIGQRWVSNSEAELGLGIIAEIENRRVSLAFPAVGERRTYAMDNAPISRVKYNVGQQIKSDDGLEITITERHEVDGCIVYVGDGRDGEVATIDEINLDSFVQFSRPLDRMFAGQIDKNHAFLLRADAITLQHRHACSPIYGLLGPRAQLLPHQFYIAEEVGRRFHPRVLLADEVGLGKTIEAGLIVHQQLMTGRAERVLIIVPETLIHQWLVEMLRRFNLQFSIVDEAMLSALNDQDDSMNPFDSAQLVLCSLSTIMESESAFANARQARWDLIVVDEAHHLDWRDGVPSPAYSRIEALAKNIAGMLLITATPEQLGIEGHFARLRLLDPERFHNLEQFIEGEKNYLEIGTLAEELIDSQEKPLSDSVIESLSPYLTKDLLVSLQTTGDELSTSRRQAVEMLLDQHGTGRVLFRNRRESVKGFPERRLNIYPLKPVESDSDADSDVIQALTPEIVAPETWVLDDPRVPWLIEWLKTQSGQKVLLITAHRSTAESLEETLRVRHGVRSAVFHEGLDLVARDRAAAYFADLEEGADLLVCSEIGSEGRSFQFAHHLVLFDLPFNPDLLEQRIGRLDRIGQTETVQIHVPYFDPGPSAVMFMWYHAGLNAFEEVCAVGPALLDLHETALRDQLANFDDTESLDNFISLVRADAEEMKQQLREGRDRLLELNSCRIDRATELVAMVRESTQALELAEFMERLFDFFGVEQQASGAANVILHPGDHMLCHSFPGLPEGGVTATYDRNEALSRDDMHFLSWEHPMVAGAIDMLLSGDFGNVALCTLKAPFLKPGTLFLEANFVFHCSGPKYLQLSRYLTSSVKRVVVDVSGKDLTEILTSERIASIADSLPKRTAQDVVKHARPQVEKMAGYAERACGDILNRVVEQSVARMNEINDAEISRLKSLAQLNPSIRREEIEFLESTKTELRTYLEGTQLRMDSARLAIAT